MSQRPRRRAVALLLSVVPGWGHVYWGRESVGLVLFTVVAVCGFAFLNASFIYQGPGRGVFLWTSGILLCTTFVSSGADLFLRTSRERQGRERESRERLLHQGTIAYLKNDFRDAVVLFRECLRINPQDTEALFRLGVTFTRSGERQQALRHLRKAMRFDFDEKWHWEIGREIYRLKRGTDRDADIEADTDDDTEEETQEKGRAEPGEDATRARGGGEDEGARRARTSAEKTGH